MTVALWIINILLALVFLAAGGMKLVKSKEAYVAGGMKWAESVSAANIKLIGTAEVLGAIGLILPFALGIAAVLTPIAAVGLTVVMLGAMATHARRKESFTPSMVLCLLSVVSAVIGFIVIL